MIPKIIHYCWLSGDSYPKKIQKCIDSWKNNLPDYEIWLWDTKRFDINSVPWVKEAFERKKYAFAADYIRLYALYNYGGIYLDSDVEVIKPYDDLLQLPYFFGYESAGYIEAATFGCEKGNNLVGKWLSYYDGKHFVDSEGRMNTQILPKILQTVIDNDFNSIEVSSLDDYKKHLGGTNLPMFSYEFFSPIDSTGRRYVLRTTQNTYSIHHFASAWTDWRVKMLVKIFGLHSPFRIKLQSILIKLFK